MLTCLRHVRHCVGDVTSGFLGLIQLHSPLSGVVETVGVAPEGAQLIASGLSTEVVETVLQSRDPSTRKLSLMWIVVEIVSCSMLTAQLVSSEVPAVTIFSRLLTTSLWVVSH